MPVAAVIAAPEVIRTFDPASFPVTWQERPASTDIHNAQTDRAAQLHKGRDNNVMCGGFVACGDAKAALASADVSVTGHYQSGFVEHAYIEPEAGFARMDGDRVEVYACTQAPVMDLEALEIILGWDRSRLRVVPTGVGGGFGSKLDISVQPYLAMAAIKTGKPVRLKGTFDLGVCKDICIPVQVRLEEVLAVSGAQNKTALKAALAAEPHSAKRAGVSGLRCDLSPNSEGVILTVSMRVNSLGGREDAAIESGDPLVWATTPKVSRKGKLLTLQTKLVHALDGSFAVSRKALRFTLIGSKRAVDIKGC